MSKTISQSNRRSATRSHHSGWLRERGMTAKRSRRGCLRVDARPELRATPDWDRFAWALLQYVRAQREQAERSQREGDKR